MVGSLLALRMFLGGRFRWKVGGTFEYVERLPGATRPKLGRRRAATKAARVS